MSLLQIKNSCCKLSDRKVCARSYGKRRTPYSCIQGPLTGQVIQSGGEDEGRRHVLQFLWLKMLGFGKVLQSPWLSD